VFLSLYKTILLKGNNPGFFKILFVYGGNYLVMLLHYFIARKYVKFALVFSSIQTILSVISNVEL
jgi:hypothetical protein